MSDEDVRDLDDVDGDGDLDGVDVNGDQVEDDVVDEPEDDDEVEVGPADEDHDQGLLAGLSDERDDLNVPESDVEKVGEDFDPLPEGEAQELRHEADVVDPVFASLGDDRRSVVVTRDQDVEALVEHDADGAHVEGQEFDRSTVAFAGQREGDGPVEQTDEVVREPDLNTRWAEFDEAVRVLRNFGVTKNELLHRLDTHVA